MLISDRGQLVDVVPVGVLDLCHLLASFQIDLLYSDGRRRHHLLASVHELGVEDTTALFALKHVGAHGAVLKVDGRLGSRTEVDERDGFLERSEEQPA